MPNIPSPAPQKNPISAPQQDQEVMGLIQRGGKSAQPPEVEKAKNDLRRIIKQVGIDPKRIVKAGEMAERAAKDTKLYPMAIQMAVKEGLLTADQVPKEPGVNWQLLSQGITAGRLAAQLIKEGAV
jgi:hypothetical protein